MRDSVLVWRIPIGTDWRGMGKSDFEDVEDETEDDEDDDDLIEELFEAEGTTNDDEVEGAGGEEFPNHSASSGNAVSLTPPVDEFEEFDENFKQVEVKRLKVKEDLRNIFKLIYLKRKIT